ncbi:unnamed protein product [Amoebophrya sp. A120]|nr:unnamed protein product [Amoebophrya sp. A120]|eukprot:GSA120T00024453001.1
MPSPLTTCLLDHQAFCDVWWRAGPNAHVVFSPSSWSTTSSWSSSTAAKHDQEDYARSEVSQDEVAGARRAGNKSRFANYPGKKINATAPQGSENEATVVDARTVCTALENGPEDVAIFAAAGQLHPDGSATSAGAAGRAAASWKHYRATSSGDGGEEDLSRRDATANWVIGNTRQRVIPAGRRGSELVVDHLLEYITHCGAEFSRDVAAYLERSAWHLDAIQLGLLASYFRDALELWPAYRETIFLRRQSLGLRWPQVLVAVLVREDHGGDGQADLREELPLSESIPETLPFSAGPGPGEFKVASSDQEKNLQARQISIIVSERNYKTEINPYRTHLSSSQHLVSSSLQELLEAYREALEYLTKKSFYRGSRQHHPPSAAPAAAYDYWNWSPFDVAQPQRRAAVLLNTLCTVAVLSSSEQLPVAHEADGHTGTTQELPEQEELLHRLKEQELRNIRATLRLLTGVPVEVSGPPGPQGDTRPGNLCLVEMPQHNSGGEPLLSKEVKAHHSTVDEPLLSEEVKAQCPRKFFDPRECGATLLLPATAFPAGSVDAGRSELLELLLSDHTSASFTLVSVAQKSTSVFASEEHLSRSLVAGAVDEAYAADFLEAGRHYLQKKDIDPDENFSPGHFLSKLRCVGLEKRLRQREDAFFIRNLAAVVAACGRLSTEEVEEQAPEEQGNRAVISGTTDALMPVALAPGFLNPDAWRTSSSVAATPVTKVDYSGEELPGSTAVDHAAQELQQPEVVRDSSSSTTSWLPRNWLSGSFLARLSSTRARGDQPSEPVVEAASSSPRVVFSYLGIVGPCRELFGNQLFDFVETLRFVAAQGPTAFLQLPRLSYTEHHPFDPADCTTCTHEDPGEYWNQMGRACDVKNGGSVPLSALFDLQFLDRFLRERWGMGGLVAGGNAIKGDSSTGAAADDGLMRLLEEAGHNSDQQLQQFDAVILTDDLPLENDTAAEFVCENFVVSSSDVARQVAPTLQHDDQENSESYSYAFFGSKEKSRIGQLSCAKDFSKPGKVNETAVSMAVQQAVRRAELRANREDEVTFSDTFISSAEERTGQLRDFEDAPTASEGTGEDKNRIATASWVPLRATSAALSDERGGDVDETEKIVVDAQGVGAAAVREGHHDIIHPPSSTSIGGLFKSAVHIGLYFYFLEEYESVRLHFARYGGLRAELLGPSIWSALRFSKKVRFLGEEVRAKLAARGVHLDAAVHWRRGDRELGSQPRKLDQYREATPIRFAELVGTKLAYEGPLLVQNTTTTRPRQLEKVIDQRPAKSSEAATGARSNTAKTKTHHDNGEHKAPVFDPDSVAQPRQALYVMSNEDPFSRDMLHFAQRMHAKYGRPTVRAYLDSAGQLAIAAFPPVNSPPPGRLARAVSAPERGVTESGHDEVGSAARRADEDEDSGYLSSASKEERSEGPMTVIRIGAGYLEQPLHPVELLALEMYLAATAPTFIGYGDGIVAGFCSAPSLIVHQMRTHAYPGKASLWAFEMAPTR